MACLTNLIYWGRNKKTAEAKPWAWGKLLIQSWRLKLSGKQACVTKVWPGKGKAGMVPETGQSTKEEEGGSAKPWLASWQVNSGPGCAAAPRGPGQAPQRVAGPINGIQKESRLISCRKNQSPNADGFRLHKAGRVAGNPFARGPTGRRVVKPQMHSRAHGLCIPLMARCSSGGPLLTGSQAEEGKMQHPSHQAWNQIAYHIIAVLPLHLRQVNTTVVGFPPLFSFFVLAEEEEKESIWQTKKIFLWDHRPGQPLSSEFPVHAWGLWVDGEAEGHSWVFKIRKAELSHQQTCELPKWRSGKESACQRRRRERCGFNPWVRNIPGEENANPPQYSCLENSMDREAWQATVHGLAELDTILQDTGGVSIQANSLFHMNLPGRLLISKHVRCEAKFPPSLDILCVEWSLSHLI